MLLCCPPWWPLNRGSSCSPVDHEDEEEDADEEDEDDGIYGVHREPHGGIYGVHREPHGEGRDVLKEVDSRLENHREGHLAVIKMLVNT